MSSRNALMSVSSAPCDSLMKTVQVVCIDHSDNSPSRTPDRRTIDITVSVKSMISTRSVVSTSIVSATTARPPTLAEVVFGTGVSRTVTTELLLIPHGNIQGSTDAYPDRKGSGFKAHTVPPL